MKKAILPILLFILVIASMFLYEKQYGYKNKELDFTSALNKEYSYVKNDIKTPITLEFSNDRVYGYAGVNRYFAGYKVEGNNIKFSPIGSTMMAGAEKDMKIESEYLTLLNNVNLVKVYQDELLLITKDNQTLTFVENNKEQPIPEDKNVIIGEEANLPQAE